MVDPRLTSCQLHDVDSPVARGDTALEQFMCYIISPIHFRKRRSLYSLALICASIHALYRLFD
jgi:hypothetical protein